MIERKTQNHMTAYLESLMLQKITSVHILLYINRRFGANTEAINKEKFMSCQYREENK